MWITKLKYFNQVILGELRHVRLFVTVPDGTGTAYWLVVSTPLKHMKVNWDDYSQLIGKKNVPNHQPDYISLHHFYTWIWMIWNIHKSVSGNTISYIWVNDNSSLP